MTTLENLNNLFPKIMIDPIKSICLASLLSGCEIEQSDTKSKDNSHLVIFVGYPNGLGLVGDGLNFLAS